MLLEEDNLLEEFDQTFPDKLIEFEEAMNNDAVAHPSILMAADDANVFGFDTQPSQSSADQRATSKIGQGAKQAVTASTTCKKCKTLKKAKK